MRTAVIRVGEPAAAGSDYPVSLFTDGGSPTWFDEPIAEASMSAAMPDANPPTDEAGQPLAPGAIIPYLLGQADPSPTFLAIGQYLMRRVAPGTVGTGWEALRQEVGTPAGPGLRTFLDIRPVALRTAAVGAMRRRQRKAALPRCGEPVGTGFATVRRRARTRCRAASRAHRHRQP